MKKLVLLVFLLFAVPAYAADCCNDRLETVSCGKDILHKGACTGDEAFVLEYDPIAKKYSLLKSFTNGNEALDINSVKVLVRTNGNVTFLSSNNERVMLDLNSKLAYFNDMPINGSGFLTRYGIRVYPNGKAELPKNMYEGYIDITVQNNKSFIQVKPGSKTDITLSHNELGGLKDTSYKLNNNSYNAREVLTIKNIYFDSGSFFASKPEPFIEAEKVSYFMYFVDDVGWTELNSSTTFKISFLGKDAVIYELDPPHKILLSLDGKINFRTDNDKYDNSWTWTVTSSPKFFLGLSASNVRQGESCIETPFGYAKICPRKINNSELVYLDFSKVNATINNLSASLIQVNSTELVRGNSSRQLLKLFIADAYAYRTLVLRNPVISVGTNITEVVANETPSSKAAEPAAQKTPVLSRDQIKLGLYIAFALLLVVLLFVFIKYSKEPITE